MKHHSLYLTFLALLFASCSASIPEKPAETTCDGHLILPVSVSESTEPHITNAEAKHLVELLLKDNGYKIHSRFIEIDEIKNSYFPDYYNFSPIIFGPYTFTPIGDYYVNPYTTEIWEAFSCELQGGKKLFHGQKNLRLKYGLPDTEKSKHPPCDLPEER